MNENNSLVSISREHLTILMLALVIGSFVVGRMTSPEVAPDPAALAPATVLSAAKTSQPEAAIVPPASPIPAAPAPTPQTPVVVKKAAAPLPVTPPVVAVAAPVPVTPPVVAVAAPQVWRVSLQGQDAVRGYAKAPVTVTVFSAFGCQPCMDFKPAVDRLLKEYQGKVKVVFKHKIFNAPHPDALLAAQAAVASQAQGKFWPMHDKLFAAGFALDRDSLIRYAGEVGMNVKRFKKLLDADSTRARVLRDSLLANEIAAHSFPNILANGVRIKKPKNYESLKALVDQELARAKVLMAQGATPQNVYAKAIEGGKFFPQLGPPKGKVSTRLAGAKGPAQGKETVEIVVFEDFECPFCAKSAPNLKIFQERFPKRVRLALKHFPLNSIHPNAQLASEASLAAKAQGKFWEMHDIMFANQKALTKEDLLRYGKELGLNVPTFKKALDGRTYKDAVGSDAADARRLGVRSTPTVLLNGRQWQGPRGMGPTALEAVSRQYLGL